MSFIRLIIKSMKLPKSLWGEILKTMVYLKNQSLSQKGVTPYKKVNAQKPNFMYLQIISSRVQVNILEKHSNKFNDRAWQGIFISYKKTNFYRIYYLLTEKIHKTRDVDIDKNLLHNKSKVNWQDFANTE